MRAFLILFICLLLPVNTHALSDKEQNYLRETSQAFKAADSRLQNYWQEKIVPLKGEFKQQILEAQKNWQKSGWDQEAKEWMKKGLTQGEAYTKALHRRINQLRVAWENSQLTPEDYGNAKADDFYNTDDTSEMAANCGIVQAVLPIDANLSSLTLSDEKGTLRTVYFYQQPNGERSSCGSISGALCYKPLMEAPVTPALRDMGITGDKILLVNECVAGD